MPQEPAGIIVTIVAHFFFGVSLALFSSLFYAREGRKAKKKAVARFIPVPAKKVIIAAGPQDKAEVEQAGPAEKTSILGNFLKKMGIKQNKQ